MIHQKYIREWEKDFSWQEIRQGIEYDNVIAWEKVRSELKIE